jgi:hypothetical protein
VEAVSEDAQPDQQPVMSWVDKIGIGLALDPTLPPGVIALRDSDGRWLRYLLAEVPAAQTQEWKP